MDSRTQRPAPKPSDISFDALLDDVFGVNIRAIKTIWVSFNNPVSYSESAWSVDWHNRFTPSFRLWFTLVAVIFFFQFLWAGNNSALIDFYTNEIVKSEVPLPAGVDYSTAATTYARINFAILPLVIAVLLFLFAYVYRAWSQKIPFVVRARYVFAIIIPSTTLSLPLFVFLGYAGQDQLIPLLLASWILPLIVDTWVASRGVFHSLNLPHRLFYSACLGGALFACNMASSIISGVLANYWIAYQYG